MKIFENHHEHNITVVHGDYCSNGCQFFHKDNAIEIFDEFDVQEQHRNDVLNAFGDVTIPDIMLYNNLVRRQIARHHEMELLRVLVNDQCRVVRCMVARHHEQELLDILVNDDDYHVRYEVARHNKDNVELLNKLVNDENVLVRNISRLVLVRNISTLSL